MNLTSITSPVASMTSLEISELTGVRHDNTRRAIEKCASDGAILLPQIEEISVLHECRNRKVKAYVFSGEQGKRDSIVVMAQLSPALTGKIVDRWQELEAKNAAPSLPDFNNPVAAARAWADAMEGKQAALESERKAVLALEAAAPAVNFVETYVNANGTFCLSDVAKKLEFGSHEFIASLIRRKILFRRLSDGWLLPYSQYAKLGYFQVKTGAANGHAFAQTRVTANGMVWLSKQFGSNFDLIGGE